MNTPIHDLILSYADGSPARFHMPGHKGRPMPGAEACDITEFDGADELYRARGVIAESEANASRLFGCRTFYSAEGSSLCIRAMLYLTAMSASAKGRGKAKILAGRNAHKTFINTAALLDIDVEWIRPENESSLFSCRVTPQMLEAALSAMPDVPDAVYLTSPDYLGSTIDISAISALCSRLGILLLVDCAHGAYLKFLPSSLYPVDLGADMCCSSAHKTLPVLTGGAYLHLSPRLPDFFERHAEEALAFFGSTSPSYLILQSLDLANPYLETFAHRLSAFLPRAEALKRRLRDDGWTLTGDEPMKLTVAAKPRGYTGAELASYMKSRGVVCEFYDPDTAVFMLSCQNSAEELSRLENALLSAERRPPITSSPPRFKLPERAMSAREALFAPGETLPARSCLGRILGSACVSCPPAVPIVTCGEIIDENGIECLEYYGVEECRVVSKSSEER
ncbi:MAG: amino acid decarboxylase [Oscillospiraceae bacterium]|nr:amino acid decarboxylase [Oscillospiraceae bacterium]